MKIGPMDKRQGVLISMCTPEIARHSSRTKPVHLAFMLLCMWNLAVAFLSSPNPSFKCTEDVLPSIANNDTTNSLQQGTYYDKASGHSRILSLTLQTLWDRISEPKGDTQYRHLTLANFVEHSGTRLKDDVVMLTHGGVSKLSNMLMQARWFGGPTDIALHVTKQQDLEILSDFVQKHNDSLTNASIHVMMEKTKLLYPHNRLRNILLDHLQCDYYVAMDGDLIPSWGAYDGLRRLVQCNMQVQRRLHSKHVFVLPSFELFPAKKQSSPTEDMLPQTKQELYKLMQDGQIAPFHFPRSPAAQEPTNYPRWFESLQADSGNSSDCTSNAFYSIETPEGAKYEPYVLGYRHGTPRYWKTFSGFGYDKSSFFHELKSAGFQYDVLQNFWAVHMNHPYASKEQKKKEIKNNRPHVQEFRKYLSTWYTKNE